MAFDQVLITDIHHYTDQLFRFRTERPASHRFTAGEFNMLTLDGKLKRAYSYTSGPYDEYLEFYSINVTDGAFTSQLSQMEVGDEIMIGKKPTGSLLMTNLPLIKKMTIFGFLLLVQVLLLSSVFYAILLPMSSLIVFLLFGLFHTKQIYKHLMSF